MTQLNTGELAVRNAKAMAALDAKFEEQCKELNVTPGDLPNLLEAFRQLGLAPQALNYELKAMGNPEQMGELLQDKSSQTSRLWLLVDALTLALTRQPTNQELS